MAREFSVHGEHLGAAAIVTAQGELDLATAGRLEEALLTAEVGSRHGVLLDLCGVDFIDSTGLRVVLGSIRRLTEEARSLTVACPDGPVRRLFQLTALTGQFDLHASREAALNALQS